MATYVISDTHFGHHNILRFQSKERPFVDIYHHDEVLIENWNSVVTPKDTVYHLGDVALGYKTNPGLIIPRLNGKKILIAGNHDHYWTTREWLDWGFEEVLGCAVYSKYIMTHIPVAKAQADRFHGNIHGHLHSHKVLDSHGKVDPWYRCVSVEQTGLKPINIDIVIKDMKRISSRQAGEGLG